MGKENKLHIILLGRRNQGKSSLINAITGQEISIVSDTAGTTTDLVKRSYEIPGFASAIFIDTAGLDDTGELGAKRVKKTQDAISQADVAILVITHNQFGSFEEDCISQLKKNDLPFIIIHNKRDEASLNLSLKNRLIRDYNVPVLDFSVREGDSSHTILEALKGVSKESVKSNKSLTSDLFSPGDFVLLVTPIDSEAPTGRMILPQVQLIRDVLDNHGIAIVVQADEITTYLQSGPSPRLVITDSQLFHQVAELIPENIPLTSFSIVLARHKGPFGAYLKGTPAIHHLQQQDRILILESCSHHVSCEDIGRHKLPAWLQQYSGKTLHFDTVAGMDNIPRPITDYAMVIQCGGCMITKKQLKNRLQPAIDAGIPVSNYGMTIAYLHNIFNRAVRPFLDTI